MYTVDVYADRTIARTWPESTGDGCHVAPASKAGEAIHRLGLIGFPKPSRDHLAQRIA